MPTPVRDIWNADTIPAGLLPWLAWAYSVDEWSANWTPEQQREAIKRSVSVHRYKGTIGAVREALDALGYGVVIQEWYQKLPEGEPYTFNVKLTTGQVGIDQPALAKIFQIINSTKNLRSHLEGVETIVVTGSEVFLGGASMIGIEEDVTPLHDEEDVDNLMTALEYEFLENEALLNAFHNNLNVTLPAPGYW
ncbi:Phage tail protein [compost metagenome]